MEPEDEYFVSTCSHVNESDEIDGCAKRRLKHLKSLISRGAKIKVALINDKHAGFAYLLPIEISQIGPIGENADVLPCMWVLEDFQKKGAGRALLDSIIRETEDRKRSALVTYAYYNDFWFMPASFFERQGFECISRKSDCGILWKTFSENAVTPVFPSKKFRYQKIEGKVTVDLFYTDFCQTCCIEAARVREVVSEFGDDVVLREYSADDREVFESHMLSRAIYINGREIGWGYEAPREGIREAIRMALDEL